MNTENESKHNQNRPVALVTGATGGIGAACCKELHSAGFLVGIHYRTGKTQATRLCQELPGAFAVSADLSDPGQIDDMLRQVKKTAGRIDVLVNNAGFSVNETIFSMNMEDFDSQRMVLRGAWYLTKKVLRTFMLRQKSGRVINISSVVGHTGNPGQIPYTMEKAAADAFTKSLAKELAGRNILVNSVAPGFIDTDMTKELPKEVTQSILSSIPLGRMGDTQEVADVVGFLATKASYVNGSVIHVNGGMYGG